jgi:hypothetical protein
MAPPYYTLIWLKGRVAPVCHIPADRRYVATPVWHQARPYSVCGLARSERMSGLRLRVLRSTCFRFRGRRPARTAGWPAPSCAKRLQLPIPDPLRLPRNAGIQLDLLEMLTQASTSDAGRAKTVPALRETICRMLSMGGGSQRLEASTICLQPLRAESDAL